jgi:hypothetical protein
MLLRGSSCLRGSGSRVSAMPPAPILGASEKVTTTLLRGLTAAGENAEVLATTRAARTINLEDCDGQHQENKKIEREYRLVHRIPNNRTTLWPVFQHIVRTYRHDGKSKCSLKEDLKEENCVTLNDAVIMKEVLVLHIEYSVCSS